jgi:hypothetical protein
MLLQASTEEEQRKLRAYKHADNLKADYRSRIIVLVKLITPPFTVSCCNDKQLEFDLHSTALAMVSIINFHNFFDVLCQTVYCVTVTYCVQVSSGKPTFSHLKLIVSHRGRHGIIFGWAKHLFPPFPTLPNPSSPSPPLLIRGSGGMTSEKFSDFSMLVGAFWCTFSIFISG